MTVTRLADQLFAIIASTRQGGRCRSCHAGITWATTFPNRKAIPLHGNPAAVKTVSDATYGAIEYIAAADSHWAHCPDAPTWKKKTR